MKNVAYAIIIIAGLLFISDWTYRNYVAYEWVRNATNETAAAIERDAGKTHFDNCQAQWPANDLVRNECDKLAEKGYQQFVQALSGQNRTAQQTVALVSCWKGNQTANGTNWALAGGCASLLR